MLTFVDRSDTDNAPTSSPQMDYCLIYSFNKWTWIQWHIGLLGHQINANFAHSYYDMVLILHLNWIFLELKFLDRQKEHWVNGFIGLSLRKLFLTTEINHQKFSINLELFDHRFICIIITEHLFPLFQTTMAGLNVVDRIVNFFVVNEGKQAHLTVETILLDQNA